jgi:hypothetical protein
VERFQRATVSGAQQIMAEPPRPWVQDWSDADPDHFTV